MKKFLSAFLSLAVALSLTALPASALELEDAKTLLQTYYVDPQPDEIWSLDSLDEILEAIGDPYTVYMNTEEYQACLLYTSSTNSLPRRPPWPSTTTIFIDLSSPPRICPKILSHLLY